MSVRIKIAKSSKELDDVFQLRHSVYVKQEGVFKEASKTASALVDRFDAFPPNANIIAYSSDEPIGTLRMNLDTGMGLPPDELYNFDEYRNKVINEWNGNSDHPPRFMSGGMLAISEPWRNRRDVLRALFKIGAGIGRTWNATHVLATVSSKTASIYKRLGFTAISDKCWIEDIGDHITPMVANFDDYYNWAFNNLKEDNRTLEAFAKRFQRLIFSPGEIIFEEGDEGHEGYIIESGTVRISLTRIPGKEQTLATFGRGELFGELSLLDQKQRSAKATALTDTELIALSGADFKSELQGQPERLNAMLEFFSARMRRTGDLVAALSGTHIQRMEHLLEDLHNSAMPDTKRPETLVCKVGLTAFANSAGVTEQEATEFLEEQKHRYKIEYTDKRIRFLERHH